MAEEDHQHGGVVADDLYEQNEVRQFPDMPEGARMEKDDIALYIIIIYIYQ